MSAVTMVKVHYLIMSPKGEVAKLFGTRTDRESVMQALGLDLEAGRWAFAQQHSTDLYWEVCASDGEMRAAMREHLRERVKVRPRDIHVR